MELPTTEGSFLRNSMASSSDTFGGSRYGDSLESQITRAIGTPTGQITVMRVA